MPAITLATASSRSTATTSRRRSQTFLEKLGESDATPGLHIEPINGSARPARAHGPRRHRLRARCCSASIRPTGRPTTSTPALGRTTRAPRRRRPRRSTSTRSTASSNSARRSRRSESRWPLRPPTEGAAHTPAHGSKPLLTELGYFVTDLTDSSDSRSDSPTRRSRSPTKTRCSSSPRDSTPPGSRKSCCRWLPAKRCTRSRRASASTSRSRSHPTPTRRRRSSRRSSTRHPGCSSPTSRDSEELRRIIEDGDFGAWRVFLHPEQREYVEKDYSGAFRLSGGAGTGKTVVLLHRARRLALGESAARESS